MHYCAVTKFLSAFLGFMIPVEYLRSIYVSLTFGG